MEPEEPAPLARALARECFERFRRDVEQSTNLKLLPFDQLHRDVQRRWRNMLTPVAQKLLAGSDTIMRMEEDLATLAQARAVACDRLNAVRSALDRVELILIDTAIGSELLRSLADAVSVLRRTLSEVAVKNT